MAVIPTGDIFKTLTLDGVSSKDYSVYITGEAVFNSPARDVEMITIPGRNGSFALDKGRFENIEVTYPAGIAADTEAEFREAISDFRNFLASRNGYVRLEDDYNPNEYRLAVYKSGLDVTPAQLRAGEFDITFDCRPQRYLKSGEDAISVDSGDVVSNPTLFASSPMLEVEGYGDIEFNGYDIALSDDEYGLIELASNASLKASEILEYDFNLANNGDVLTLTRPTFEIAIYNQDYTGDPFDGIYDIVSDANNISITTDGYYIKVVASYSDIATTFGTTSNFFLKTISCVASVGQRRMQLTLRIYVSGMATGFRWYCVTSTASVSGYSEYSFSPQQNGDATAFKVESVKVVSTASVLGHPTYIDCDLGEAYKEVDGSIISLNRYIDLGSDLPTLAPGANTVTFDNTITDLQIVPRWWKI
jgi:phage-related protein